MKPTMAAAFARNAFVKSILLIAIAGSLSACGNAGDSALPDDPTSEPVTQLDPLPPDGGIAPPPAPQPTPPPALPPSEEDAILQKYNHLDPDHQIQDKHLKAAILYFDKNKTKIKNSAYLSVIDFSKSSKLKRFFVINMQTGSVWALHTAHGKGSDANHDGYAESFSNVSGSNASSLGFYMTAETYTGEHGLSLRLDGLSSTNSRARPRAIVIHGADYVQEANVIQGRSWGCPAIAMEHRTTLINMLKNGSLIYAAN